MFSSNTEVGKLYLSLLIAALQALIDCDIDKVAAVWKHPCIEDFSDRAWAEGALHEKQLYPTSRLRRLAQFLTTSISQPRFDLQSFLVDCRMLWFSHILSNTAYFVILTVFVYSETLLVEYPHPYEIALMILFFVPSLFPPYSPTFLGYLTINILFVISFIFRGIAFREWPFPSISGINLLLNSRTLLSFLPLIQMTNLVLITFPIPSMRIGIRVLFPLFPIAIMLFIGFFLSLHFLADTHHSVQRSLDILLRTVLLNIDPGKATQFHPVAARIVYYLFAFSSLYFFWGFGIAGMGMRIVTETDWHAERVRGKAVRLLRYLPARKNIRRKRLLGRGKVSSTMPFTVFEGIGIVLRIRWLRDFAVYFGMFPVVLIWSLGLGIIAFGRRFWIWLGKFGKTIVDEIEEDDSDAEEEESEESARLLS
jgi:hypothetical protein